jgi:hypothetical protein
MSATTNPGLHAFIHGRAPVGWVDEIHAHADTELDATTAGHIAAWADADVDLAHMAGSYAVRPEAAPCAVPQPGEAATELGADTGRPAPLSLARRALIAHLQRRSANVADERRRYEDAGAIGPIFKRNSIQLQLDLMARIRALQEGAPLTRTIATALVALASGALLVLAACGGGGSDEEPQPRQPADCAKTPELCK